MVRALFLNKILFYDVNLEKNIVLYAKRGKQGHVEEYFALDRVKVNYNEGLGSKLPITKFILTGNNTVKLIPTIRKSKGECSIGIFKYIS